MVKQMRAVVVPFSSIVGSSVTLHAPDGRVEGQLALLNFGRANMEREEFKKVQLDAAEEVARAINWHHPMLDLLRRMDADMQKYLAEGGGESPFSMEVYEQVRALVKKIGA